MMLPTCKPAHMEHFTLSSIDSNTTDGLLMIPDWIFKMLCFKNMVMEPISQKAVSPTATGFSCPQNPNLLEHCICLKLE